MDVNLEFSIRQRQDDAGGRSGLPLDLNRGLRGGGGGETTTTNRLNAVERSAAVLWCHTDLLYALVHVRLSGWFHLP